MSRFLRGRIKRLEATRGEEEEDELRPLTTEELNEVFECASALASGDPLPHTLTKRQLSLATDFAEQFRRITEHEDATRNRLAYLLLSEGDACLLIGSYERRNHLQEAYGRAIEEKSHRAIQGNIGLIGHRDRTPEEETKRAQMIEDLIQRAERLGDEVKDRTGRAADPLRSWSEVEEEAFYVNSVEYLKKVHPEWFQKK